jgi:hypothetical protein
MRLNIIKKIVDEVFPKIESHYGYSKFRDTTPYIEYENSLDGAEAEYDFEDNMIVLYYPKIKDREHLIQSLIHEYQHYLQSPSWYKRYETMGYEYDKHPYELKAYEEESNYKLFM